MVSHCNAPSLHKLQQSLIEARGSAAAAAPRCRPPTCNAAPLTAASTVLTAAPPCGSPPPFHCSPSHCSRLSLQPYLTAAHSHCSPPPSLQPAPPGGGSPPPAPCPLQAWPIGGNSSDVCPCAFVKERSDPWLPVASLIPHLNKKTPTFAENVQACIGASSKFATMIRRGILSLLMLFMHKSYVIQQGKNVRRPQTKVCKAFCPCDV